MTFAASQGKVNALRCLIAFVRQKIEGIANEVSLSNSESDKSLVERQIRKTIKRHFKNTISQWINMRDRTELRASALHLAAFSGDINTIRLLAESDADMTVTTASGVSALHMAS